MLMTNFSRILNALSGLYSEEKNQYIDSLNQYSLLIIDDWELSAVRSLPWNRYSMSLIADIAANCH